MYVLYMYVGVCLSVYLSGVVEEEEGRGGGGGKTGLYISAIYTQHGTEPIMVLSQKYIYCLTGMLVNHTKSNIRKKNSYQVKIRYTSSVNTKKYQQNGTINKSVTTREKSIKSHNQVLHASFKRGGR